jgi:hypothetical protein
MEYGVIGAVVGFAGGVIVTMKFSSKVSAAIASLEATAKEGLQKIETALKGGKL